MPEFIPYDNVDDADIRSAEMWSHVRGEGWQPGNVTQYLYGRRRRTGDPETDADLPDGVDAAIQITDRDDDLDTLVQDDVMQPQEGAAVAALYPSWQTGQAYKVDDLLEYNGDLYKVRQAHTSIATWSPDQVPSLFIRWREDADTLLAWVAWEDVRLGWRRTYSGSTYECIQAHVTQPTWTPDVTPALWSAV